VKIRFTTPTKRNLQTVSWSIIKGKIKKKEHTHLQFNVFIREVSNRRGKEVDLQIGSEPFNKLLILGRVKKKTFDDIHAERKKHLESKNQGLGGEGKKSK